MIEVVGGGGGGHRRELNVLKRSRISGALLILLWKCDDLAVLDFSREKMKETIDTYSGPTARLIFAIFSLPLGVWSDVHEEHQITRG